MIGPAQADYIRGKAYLPEHIPAYVSAISGLEAQLVDEYVCYAGRERMVFVGYPLDRLLDEKRLMAALAHAREQFRPSEISLIAPAELPGLSDWERLPTDQYYLLDLLRSPLSKKVRNTLKRAAADLVVCETRDFSKEHQKLVDQFLRDHRLEPAARAIYAQLPAYLCGGSPFICEARDRHGRLAALAVGELSPEQYGCYMFSFRHSSATPGAADLLLAEIIRRAREKGQRYLNLGLGINPGIAFFKEKWGGKPFLPHYGYSYRQLRLGGFLDALLGRL